MATRDSDTAAIQAAPTAKSTVDPIIQNGELGYYECLYTVTSATANADVLRLVKVPAGMRLLTDLSNVVSDETASAASFIIKVGDDDDSTAADDDRYAVGLDVSATGVDKFDSTAAVARLTPYTTGKECWIQAVITTFTSVTVGTKLRFKLYFAHN